VDSPKKDTPAKLLAEAETAAEDKIASRLDVIESYLEKRISTSLRD
jgi:hypothetical protein